MKLFRRSARTASASLAATLGRALVAARLQSGDGVPAGAILVTFDGGGRSRRGPEPENAFKPAARGKRLALDAGETAFCFHPGPYDALLIPFEAAPELGLRLRFVIDAADPRVEQQRFDLFLHSEAGERLMLDDLVARVQAALRVELGQGNLLLPPCAALDEWDGFRAGLNQLLYTRFGLTVEDCLPADLGHEVDFAALLAQRANAPASPAPGIVHADADAVDDGVDAMASTAIAAPVPPAPSSLLGVFSAAFAAKSAALNAANAAALDGPGPRDARALRRLFLELPAATAALRQLPQGPGRHRFIARQALLTRLEMASLRVATMPSLEWAAPDQPLAQPQQRRRADASDAAQAALDEAWALLARWQLAAGGEDGPMFDEAGRILANLETALAARHATSQTVEEEPAPDASPEQRREPT
jgi:hypothetical protein